MYSTLRDLTSAYCVVCGRPVKIVSDQYYTECSEGHMVTVDKITFSSGTPPKEAVSVSWRDRPSLL